MTLNREEQIKIMAKNCDKSLVRGKDLRVFNQVVGSLRENT